MKKYTGGDNMSNGDEKPESNSSKCTRTRYDLYVILSAFVLIFALFAISLWKWPTSSDVTSVLSAVTGVIGTLVGAYFGVQVGSSGKADAISAQKAAENKNTLLALATNAEQIDKIPDDVKKILTQKK